MRRELGDLLAHNMAAGRMVFVPYLPLGADFFETEYRYPRYVAPDLLGPQYVASEYFRSIPYPLLLGALSAARSHFSGVTVFYDKTLPRPAIRRTILESFKRCYPEYGVWRGRFIDAYQVSAAGLAAARCYSGVEITPESPPSDQEIGGNAPVRFTWRAFRGAQTAFRLQVERHDDRVVWVEAEDFSQENGWAAQGHEATGFSGRGYLTDLTKSNSITARRQVEIPGSGRYEIWVRSLRRRDDGSPVFLSGPGFRAEVAHAEPTSLNQWRWESLGWHELAGGAKEFAFTRRFDQGFPWQIFIDAVVVSDRRDFDPSRERDWGIVLDTGDVTSPERKYQLLRRLQPGRYRWRVRTFEGDRLVDWDGSLGVTSEDSYFRIAR